jgi:2-oxoisovalerate dehydrogenase E2 component (dihydrolipoyl transacylase)
MACFGHYDPIIHESHKINLGIALDGKDGLFVPVIKDVEGLLQNKQIREKIENFKVGIKNRSLTPEDFKGTTITLSNFGMIAGRYATAIIVPPQVAILGVGKIREVVVPKGKIPIISKALPLSLVFDHRVITGGEAARFLHVLIKVLES